MKPLRVCFLIQAMSDGGAQKQCIYLLNELQKRNDIELHLIYFFSGIHDHLLETANLAVHRLEIGSNYNPLNIVQLLKLLKQIQPDILVSWLHACDAYSFFVKRSIPRMRWLMTERDSSYPPDPRYWLRRQLGIYADAIIANSEKGKAYWQDAGANCPCFVVPNIVKATPIPGSRAQSAIYVGRLEQQKNVTTVVRSFCVLARRRSELKFFILGEGSLRPELEAIVRAADLERRIDFLGFQQNVLPHLSRAGVVVSLSHHEGLPNAMLESVAAGTLVVASDIPEHRELLGPDYPFYVVDRNSPEASAAVIDSALQSKNYDVLGFSKARISKMEPQTISETYMSIFRSIAGCQE